VQPRELPIPGLKEAAAQVDFVSPKALQKTITAGEHLALIDLRSAGDFATAHIPGACWLSRGRVELQVDRQVPHSSTPIVVYCRRGRESILSAATLRQSGYPHVMVLDGGFDAWKAAGFPTGQGLGAQSEFEELAVAEVGLLGSGPYGYSNERMAKYLQDEEELGKKYRQKIVSS